MKNLTEYKLQCEGNEKVINWVSKNLVNYLKKNEENQTEIEHIIDYLKSDKAPTRIQYMSYDEAKSNTEKWTAALIKKAAGIVETEDDTETVIDFKDGFKLVKLVGKAAYDREGNLMRHCVSSYYGNDVEIYSLRDANNNPHCTMEISKNGDYVQQIKGKGNGSIHPKYINYVIQSLKEFGLEVNGNELSNLGYSDINYIKGFWQFLDENFEDIKYITFNNTKYFYNKSTLKRKVG